MTVLALLACGGRPAEDWYVVCDVTGVQDSCSAEFRSEVAFAWSRSALGAPGSTLQFILVADSFGSTAVRSIDPPPSSFPRPAKPAQEAWQINTVKNVLDLVLENNGKGKSRSDLFSGFLIAADLANGGNGDGESVSRLIVASDGFFIDGRFNTEREGFPSVERVLEHLRGSGVESWSSVLGQFDDIELCGFGNEGLDAKSANDRSSFYGELFRVGGKSTVRVVSRCSDAYPALAITLEAQTDLSLDASRRP